MASQNDLSQEERAVDVSGAESQYSVQCEDVRLLASVFRPLTDEDGELESSRFSFEIKAFVHQNEAFSYLETQVINVPEEEDEGELGFFLKFSMIGRFVAGEGIAPQDLGHFCKLYTLSILWPYAREYASDQLRRAGEAFVSLPIINPQVVTEHLIEEDLVQVTILEDDSDESTS